MLLPRSRAPAVEQSDAPCRHILELALPKGERGAATLVGRRSECEALDLLIADMLAGVSRVLVLRGEAGVGKSALLGYLSDRIADWRIARAVGVESEMELAYSGLHQLRAGMLDHLERLPVPQRDALATVFGRSSGSTPDQFMVALATLTLLAEVAESSRSSASLMTRSGSTTPPHRSSVSSVVVSLPSGLRSCVPPARASGTRS
jgi:AAA ATPase-like protein